MYAFSCKYTDCPNCGTNLTNNEGHPSVIVDDSTKTTIADQYDFLASYILEPSGDGCLLLDNPNPSVKCLACNHTLDASPEEY